MAKSELSVDDKFELLIQALTQRADGGLTLKHPPKRNGNY